MSTEQNTIYGTDIRLKDSGDILIGANGDLHLIYGINNLKQAIKNLLDCPQGWLFEDPEYGSRLEKYWGQPNTIATRYAAARDMQDALTLDPRIAKVESLTTRKVSDTRFDIDCVVVPINQTERVSYIYPVQL